MVDVGAGQDGGRARRRTWMLGGALLTASAFLDVALRNVPLPSWMWYVGAADLLFAAGVVIFAVGLGRPGSVVARDPLGMGALGGLAGWTLFAPILLSALLPSVPPDADAMIVPLMLSVTVEVVALSLALIGVMRIGRTNAVPARWRWAPLWMLLAVAAVRVLRSGFLFGTLGFDQEALLLLDGTATLAEASAVGFLGVLAMVLAGRAPISTTVYRSAG